MDFKSNVARLRAGEAAKFPAEAKGIKYALELDEKDELRHLRDEFIIPTRRSLKKKDLDGKIPGIIATNGETQVDETGEGAESIYFVGNSLGCQPKCLRKFLDAHLETWASIGVAGHYTNLDNSPLVNWQSMAEDCARRSAEIVGASPSEIIVMNSLTVNLQLMMASFYRPTTKRHKIIMEWKPFPSDHYAVESHIKWHKLDPGTSMVKIQPNDDCLITTAKILETIDEHAEKTALILLPGLQYYSGQFFDMPRITAYAQERGILVGWDLAHAVGNVELSLHDWNVDFAFWCTYKYLNSGPGSIAGVFVHERHGKVDCAAPGDPSSTNQPRYHPRLSGWYGGDIKYRFNMSPLFIPTPGAQGYQLSNPSVLDLAAHSAALSIFNMTSMQALRSKSLVLTAYAEFLLDQIIVRNSTENPSEKASPAFRIISPRNPLERGVQLSVLVHHDGLLNTITENFVTAGILCDQRKPNVIRVAPAPMYCTFTDVWRFMDVLDKCVESVS